MEIFIQKLILEKILKTPSIISAFKKIHRADFVPEAIRQYSDEDRALPTFENQTISQPYTVAFMLELLKPKEGEKILDVGSGSGWVAGMLAHIVGKKGKVFAIELVPELVQFSIDNLRKYRFNNLKIIKGDGSAGLPKIAPFDAIHAAAAGKTIPLALKVQLKVGGRLIAPTQKNDIRLIKRISKKKWEEKIYKGFVFVPLIKGSSG